MPGRKKKTARRRKSAGPKVSTGQRLLDKIGDLLSQPDARTWVAHYLVNPTRPMNIRYRNSARKRYYRGINWFWLSLTAAAHGYRSSEWLTMRQANAMGSKVRKGEKAAMVVFWKFFDTESEDPDTGEIRMRRRTMMRAYNVFNVEQTEGIDLNLLDEEETIPGEDVGDDPEFAALAPVDRAALALQLMREGPAFAHNGGVVPHYNPSSDTVQMPPPSQFDCPENYMQTKLHEYAHSTGHPARLNREGFEDIQNLKPMALHERGMEEMIACFAATMMASEFGLNIPDLEENAAAYIRSWQAALDDSAKGSSLITACQRAQKVCDYIMNGGAPVADAAPADETETAAAPETAAVAAD